MMKSPTLSMCAIALATFMSFGVVQAKPDNAPSQQKPCPGLTGKARTDCLQAEVARGRRESDAGNKKVQRLDKAIKVACGADKVAPVAAGAVAKGGSLAYKAGRAVGDKATGQKPCG